MKFTDMIRRAEELQMVYSLFRRTLAGKSQTEALIQVATEAGEAEQLATLQQQQETLDKRLEAIGTIAHRMIGGYSEDDLVNAIDKLAALMETHSQLRAEQARIKLEMELVGMASTMSNERRRQAEQALTQIKEQLEVVASEVAGLFPSPKMLITV